MIGNIPWNKGLTKETDERVKIASNAKVGNHWKVKDTSKMKGKKVWNKGKKGVQVSCRKGKKYPQITGNKHYNYKGGISYENKKIRGSLEYTIWRNEVYKKDRWTCRICGKHCEKNDIVAHHLKLFSEFPELRFSIDNGITLCRSCHIKLHKPIK